MTTDARDKLIARIKKLLALGEAGRGATEAEMESAVTKAKQMMAAHAVELAELELDQPGDTLSDRMKARMRTHTAYTRKGSLARYDYNVAAAVNAVTGTRTMRQTGDGYTRLKFTGDEDDVAVASEFFFILLECVRSNARQRYGRGWSESHTSYAMGFSHRLRTRAEEAVIPTASTSVALVLASKAVVVEAHYLAQINPNKRFPKAKPVRDTEAWWKGNHDGGNVNLSAKVMSGGTAIRTRNRS